MQAGQLRNRVGFFRRPSNNDSPDYGVADGEFAATADFECAANIRPRLGGEQVLAARQAGTNLVNITVRRSADTAVVTTGWKAKDLRSGVEYNIRSIIDPNEGDTDRGTWIEMLCEKGVAP